MYLIYMKNYGIMKNSKAILPCKKYIELECKQMRYELVQRILKGCRQEKVVVTTYMSNGFQMRGKVAMSDQHSFVLVDNEKIARAISYDQISTIDFPIKLVNEMGVFTKMTSSTEPFFIMRTVLEECRTAERRVHVYMSNGFQMRGNVMLDDAFSFILLPDDRADVAHLIFFAQLSTIDFPLPLLKNVSNHFRITPTQGEND